jgi:hypothetical protein
MIIRKNRQQYVMVLACQGVNYDLLSEEEKVAVEEGFTQFLNTLRFQVQLYIQTRSLNLRDIMEDYKTRIKNMEKESNLIDARIKDAHMKENEDLAKKLEFQKKRKENVLEYGADISEYVGRLSLNKNILQQKTYVIVAYNTNELGVTNTYAKEELDAMCFAELYTRAQSVARSLASSEVMAKILNSEELAELVYVAYNRDDSEIMQFNKALESKFDSLYSTSIDVLEKKKAQLNEKIEEEAIKLATESIQEADRELRNT